MKPMLAKKYIDYRKKITFPLFVQPKLNGVRGLFYNGRFQSRDEHYWSDAVVGHFVEQLADIPSTYILDGEFYLHGWPLQKINGAISVNRVEPSIHTHFIQYHIFDFIDLADLSRPFSSRAAELRNFVETENVFTVPTYEVFDEIEGDHWYNHFKSADYEGMMYRTDEPYGVEFDCGNKENRWTRLLKRKDKLDEDCLIVDVELGTGKYSNCVGSLLCVFPNGKTFSVGSGLSDAERLRYMDEPPIHKMAKIEYEALSLDGIPTQPTLLAVLD